MDNIKLQIKYHSKVIDKLCQAVGVGDWIDLRSAEDITLTAGSSHLVNLGISIALPKGYEAIIVPRSSTFKNYGLLQTNSIGIIDESYSGENDIWMLPVFATRDTHISINDRICQFRVFKHQPVIDFIEVENMVSLDRGGFGSTGIQ